MSKQNHNRRQVRLPGPKLENGNAPGHVRPVGGDANPAFEEALGRACGTQDMDLSMATLRDLSGILDSEGKDMAGALNVATAAMAGIAPRDEAEGLLAAQMAATHHVALDCLKKAQAAGCPQAVRELNLRYADRFLRTYATQMEALKRYRTSGQQRVTVEHVHVHQGGQAIVGNVQHGGQSAPAGALPEPPEAVTLFRGDAMAVEVVASQGVVHE